MSARRRGASVRFWGALALAAAAPASAAAPGAAGAGPASSPGTPAPPIRLVWHVETREGQVLDSRDGAIPINPASVVKIATTLWALERLGPEHRFETRFAARGKFDPATGVLDGDLLVFGGADPDFHVDNAWLVGLSLNAAGLRTVTGRLLVDGSFWIGWEGGSQRKTGAPAHRAATMASRLRDAWDPARWDRATRRQMVAVAARRRTGSSVEAPPKIVIRGGGGTLPATDGGVGTTLAVHRSNPLRRLLDRLNTYSNNDIERLEVVLGSPGELATGLAARWQIADSPPILATLSGLGSNRMTPGQIVRLLRDLDAACQRLGLGIEVLLPTAGCGSSTLEAFRGIPSGSVVAKTGTLVRTDGGIAVLTGIARTTSGDRYFCVAAPAAGDRLAAARKAEQGWLLDLIARSGGASARGCDAAVGYSDDEAVVISVP